jgi:2-desacetyl-2-hydroxyethyl bacteriochlorophyllide A dehydrogenase
LDTADEGYGNGVEGRALRFVAPRRVEIQRVEVHPPAPEELLVRTRWSGISGGTELLAYRGELDPGLEIDETLPSLSGSFRFPFAYGYSCVGEVEHSRVPGIEEGSTVFAFHPHQDRFTVRASEIAPLDAVDGRVATMFPLVETALQVSLDAGARIEEQVVVLGLGPVGVLTAALLLRSGADVVGVDPRADRRAAAIRFGVWAVDASEIRRDVEISTSGAGVPLVVDVTGTPVPFRSRWSSSRTRGRRWSAAGTGTRRWRSRSAARSIGAGCRSGARRSRRSPRARRIDGTCRGGDVPPPA